MNPRVLELIKNPKNIQLEDLGLLKEEIHAFPYIQNIRALHLYGVHLYEKENYQKELSTTAAYTTDKKILYQLINGKIRQEPKLEPPVEAQTSKAVEKESQLTYKNTKSFPIKREEESSSEKNTREEEITCVLPNSHDVKTVYVNGERNRIMFEGEENFLEEKNSETIDIESTLESGTLVTQKTEPIAEPVVEREDTQAEIEENAGENFTPETLIEADDITSVAEEVKVEEEENTSFQEVEPILPTVTIEEKDKEELTEIETVVEEDTQAEIEENAGENFTPETLIEADEITSVPEEVKVEEEENTSFQEIEPVLPEVNIEEEHQGEPEDAEKIVENKDIPVRETEESDAEVSFHGTEAFLPDVKIETSNEEIMESAEVSQPNVNKHEEEMRRLIEEVEKKMKETKSVPQQKHEETESVPDHEISFAETQSFHFWSTSEESPVPEPIPAKPVQEEKIETQPVAETVQPEETEASTEKVSEARSAWKPMSVESHIPDSLISKTTEAQSQSPTVSVHEEMPVTAEETETGEVEQEPQAEEETLSEEGLPAVEENAEVVEIPQNTKGLTENIEVAPSLKDEEVPVMNVSFFGTDISTLRVDEKNEERKEEKPVEEKEQEKAMKKTTQSPVDSNVPGFINTWQSWLKIDRTEEIEKEKAEIKEKAIETFIENNPRISQLKEESTYVVKEKNDDISHLMTETLANLYFEQKLYSKAVKAFEILKKKYPEKADYFNAKIKEVNDSKSGK